MLVRGYKCVTRYNAQQGFIRTFHEASKSIARPHRCPCKEALHGNTKTMESNWTDVCSESYNNWYFLFITTWHNIDILPGLVSRPIKFLWIHWVSVRRANCNTWQEYPSEYCNTVGKGAGSKVWKCDPNENSQSDTVQLVDTIESFLELRVLSLADTTRDKRGHDKENENTAQ